MRIDASGEVAASSAVTGRRLFDYWHTIRKRQPRGCVGGRERQTTGLSPALLVNGSD
jgi:hypothetical protein